MSFQLQAPAPDCESPAREFLRLEQLGWKGELRTAIASRPDHEDFFLRAIRGFAAGGRAVFGELRIDDRVIASTCNLVAGSTLFALKLGWDPAFASGSPGFWSEIELASAVRSDRPDLLLIDSCSQAGSYVEAVAAGQVEMGAAVYVWSRRASALCTVRRQLRALRS